MVDFLGAPQRLAVYHENRNCLRARERDQFLLIVGILSNILLDDFVSAMEIGHAIQHALRDDFQ